MTDQKNGQEYLSFVLEKLQASCREISWVSAGFDRKKLKICTIITGRTIPRWTSTDMRITTNQHGALHQVNANPSEQLLLAEPLPENAGFSVLRACVDFAMTGMMS